MSVKRKKEVTGKGIAFLKGTRVTRFIEKPGLNSPQSNLTNAGRYILNTKVFGLLPKKKRFSFEEDFLQNSAPKINLQAYLTRAESYSIDTPEKLERARKNWRA